MYVKTQISFVVLLLLSARCISVSTTVTGEVLKTAQFDLSNGPLEISLEEFESGFYNISVSNNREIFTSRVVKE